MDCGRGELLVAAAGQVAGAGQRGGLPAAAAFAGRWPQASWAIEGAGGLGAPLASRLCGEGIAVLDVPAKLAARVRLLSTGHGRKNDDADAISVGIAALTATGLRTVAIDDAVLALRALVEHHDDLVKTRTQTFNRLHRLLTQLIPGGSPIRLAADTAAQLLRTVRAQTAMLATLRALASDLIAEIRRLDRRIAATATEITTAVQASGSSLTQLHGIGNLLAGKILARSATSADFAPRRHLLPTPAPRRSRCPLVTSSATGCPVPATANSTPACIS